jgi:DNA modification methylase
MQKFDLINGDCVSEAKNIQDNSIHLSVFSPPFAELYVYSDDHRDMGNSRNYEEFFTHFNFLTPELYRIMMPGRIVAVHCMDLPIQKGKEGYIGLRDFSGMLIKNFQDNGFIYHAKTTIWKDPVVEMQRTKSLGLLHKQVKKDSSMSRVGLPDYVLFFRKEGVNPEPIKNMDIPVDLWQQYASPVWMDINYSDTLNNYREGRHDNDEKHICPLQLGTIKRIIHLYSNKGDMVFSPFAGIGSEGFQALKMGRTFTGIELKESYYNIAVQNLKNAEILDSQMILF